MKTNRTFMKLLVCVLSLSMMLVTPFASFAEVKPSADGYYRTKITFTVKCDGAPVKGARVTYTYLDDEAPSDAKNTDKNGKCTFEVLCGDRVQWNVFCDGYEDWSSDDWVAYGEEEWSEEANIVKIEKAASKLFTGEPGNPLKNGKWATDANGDWTYTTTARFTNTWAYIVNKADPAGASWYYFNEKGKMVTGLQKIAWNGKTANYYFIKKAGPMLGACQLTGVTPEGYKINPDATVKEK